VIDCHPYFLDESPSDPPRIDSLPLQLESRGTTQQIHQTLLWAKCTIHKNTVAAKLRAVLMLDEAAKLEACHSRYTFAVCAGCHRVNKFPNRCDLFYCPECQPRRSEDRKKAVEWWCNEIGQPKHVVLTVKNVPNLSKGHLHQLMNWFTRLRRRVFCKNWRGGFYSIEVTNEGRGWHLHLHCLVDAGWIDAVQLSAEWQSVTNGMGRIVKVKDARGKHYLAEVTKYCVKGVQLASWSPAEIKTFVEAFDGKKTFGVFGSLYGARTRFKEWWRQIRDVKPICECGCSQARYYSEAEFLESDLVCTDNSAEIPPPKPIAHPEFSQILRMLPPR